MARIQDIAQPIRDAVQALEMPALSGEPFVAGLPLAQRRVVIVTSAALHRRSEPPFQAGSAEFRELPSAVPAGDLIMSHVSINFDRAAFQRDINVAYPIERLKELQRDGVIGHVGETHFSVMGSTDPATMRETVDALVARFKRDSVDAVLFCPV